MNTRGLVFVISPVANMILETDAGGRPVGAYLTDELRTLGADVRFLGDGPAVDATAVPGSRSPVPEGGDTGHDVGIGGVLVVDARAWLPRPSLVDLLPRARDRSRGLRVVVADSGSSGPEHVLAVYAPISEIKRSLTSAHTVPGQGLESVFAAGALDEMASVSATDLGEHGTALLIQSHEDVYRIEAHVLLGRAYQAMQSGVRVRDPRQLWIRGELVSGSGVEIDINVIVEGSVVLGDGVHVGAHTILRDTHVGARTRIHPFSLIENATVGADGRIGPYARIRPETAIADRVQIGNFVEIKSAKIGLGCRINHHAFIGNAVLGDDVTIGAGTITCNHDGVRFNETIIERGAYIGSGCSLVAPLRVGEGATIGAGSTVTHDVPPAKLTVARSRQVTIDGWQGPRAR
jgi:acetyltransferase-like isoleucine patch superfamily enzyme